MGRQRCRGCERPLSVCLCPHLPTPPFHTRTSIVVLQHPHEARHKLSTLPVLCQCLSRCRVVQGRRFQPGSCPLLDYFASQTSLQRHLALLLFPSDDASPIDVWVAHHQRQGDRSCSQISFSNSDMRTYDGVAMDSGHQRLLQKSTASCLETSEFKPSQGNHGLHDSGQIQCEGSSLKSTFLQTGPVANVASAQHPDCFSLDVVSQQSDTFHRSTNGSVAHPVHSSLPREDSDLPHLVLIAIDATWQHATEMIKASASYLSPFAIPVCLPYDAEQKGPSMAESAVILRKEPFKGCMSTLEAIASCLKVLEPNGAVIHEKLLAVLRSMVHFQASHISSHKVRRHEYKKN